MSINLQKGQKVSLKKNVPTGLGEILVNLNWNSKQRKKGFLASLFGSDSAIDLDLGCLYELKNGQKGAVQALGNAFGSLDKPPFVSLDGDDRTGDVAGGENLRINGNKISEIKRVLVYTFIYEAEDIVVKMDDFNSSDTMCALALFENINDETFSVEKLIQFYRGHESLDRAFNWRLKWVVGKK